MEAEEIVENRVVKDSPDKRDKEVRDIITQNSVILKMK